MGLNSTEAEKSQRAAEDLALKMRLEPALEKKMQTIFDRIARDLERQLSNNGGTISAVAYERAFANALNTHYIQVQKAFNGQIADYAEEVLADLDVRETDVVLAEAQAIEEDDEVGFAFILEALLVLTLLSKSKTIIALRERIRFALDSYRQEQVLTTASALVNTTQKDIDRAVNVATQQVNNRIEDNPDINLTPQQVNKAIATEARSTFERSSNSRPQTIAVTETQKVSESTKDIERTSIAAAIAPVTAFNSNIIFGATETWVTMGDSRVRPAHIEADFTTKVNGAFEVGGERLRYPGDRSLGASLNNVINCRCSSVMSIE